MSVRRLDPVQPESFAFTQENLAWAKETIGKYPEGKQASAVIPILWRAQEQEGWVSRAGDGICRAAAGYGLYPRLRGRHLLHDVPAVAGGRQAHIQVCGTTPCMLRGAEELKTVCRAPHRS